RCSISAAAPVRAKFFPVRKSGIEPRDPSPPKLAAAIPSILQMRSRPVTIRTRSMSGRGSARTVTWSSWEEPEALIHQDAHNRLSFSIAEQRGSSNRPEGGRTVFRFAVLEVLFNQDLRLGAGHRPTEKVPLCGFYPELE